MSRAPRRTAWGLDPRSQWARQLLTPLVVVPLVALAFAALLDLPVLRPEWVRHSLATGLALALPGVLLALAYRRRLRRGPPPDAGWISRRLAAGAALADLPAYVGVAGFLGGRPVWELAALTAASVAVLALLRPPPASEPGGGGR